ncbi:hypothetical protein GQX74_001632 [Glossina fuscipes]|nr:hypothetical protein GQX74_001632 [Glossina fuscipes]
MKAFFRRLTTILHRHAPDDVVSSLYDYTSIVERENKFEDEQNDINFIISEGNKKLKKNIINDFDVTNFSNLAAVPSKKWQTNSKPHFGFYVYSTKTLKILKGIHVYLLCVKYYYIVTIPNLVTIRQSNNQWCLCNQTELSPPTVLNANSTA